MSVDEGALRRTWEASLGPQANWDGQSPSTTYKPSKGTGKIGPRDPLMAQPDPSGPSEPQEARTMPAAPPAPARKADETAATLAEPASAGPAPLARTEPLSPSSDYEILDELGRGGMGVVYRARQKSLKREVAIKRILTPPHHEDIEEKRATFVAEALVTGALDHPNIVPVHQLAILGGGEVFLSMKLVGGTSWKRLLHPVTDDEKRRSRAYDRTGHMGILTSVCNAVAFAHSKSVLHRDLKPENVMVGDFGEVLVMDWGLAVDMAEGPREGSIAPPRGTGITMPSGTPCYMAPELAMGDANRMGPATDVYLLGAILHEIVTGKPPHEGNGLMAVLRAAVESAPPGYEKDVPQELQDICRRAMAREPAARYPTVLAFREAIASFLEHRESLAISDSAAARLESCIAAFARRAGPVDPNASGDVEPEDRDRLYSDFADALAGFREARALWEGNEAARKGEQHARLAYAEAALASRDLGLARSQAVALDAGPEREALLSRIDLARATRERAARAAHTVRRALVGAVVLIIGGLLAVVVLIEGQHAALQTELATEKRQKDEIADKEALAEANEREARRNADLAREREQDARRSAFDAEVKGLETETARAWSLRALVDPLNLKTIEKAQDAVAALVSSAAHVSGERDRLRLGSREESGFAAISSSVANLALATLEDERERDPRALGGGPWAVRACSKDGEELLLGAGPICGVYRRRRPERPVLLRGHTDAVIAAAFSDDGKRVLTASRDETLRLWDAASGALLGILEGHTKAVTACGFLHDGKRAVSGSEDGTLLVWDLETRTVVQTKVDPGGAIVACSVGWDDAVLSVTSSGSLLFWTVQGPARDIPAGAERRPVTSCAFSPRENLAVSGDVDGTVSLWDSADGACLGTVPHGRPVCSVAFAPDGQTVLATQDDGLLVFMRVTADRELEAADSYLVSDVEWTQAWFVMTPAENGPREQLIVLGSARAGLAVWDPVTRELQALPRQHEFALGGAFSPDGKVIATTSSDGIVSLWDHATGALVRAWSGHSNRVPACAFSPDGQEVLTGSSDGTLRLWDAASGNLLRSYSAPGAFLRCAFSPDGQLLLSASSDGQLRLWDRGHDAPLRAVQAHQDQIAACSFSPDGQQIVSGSLDKTVALWDTATLALVQRLEGHTEAVRCCAFSADGKRVVSGGDDGTVRVWEPSCSIFRAIPPEHVQACWFAPDGESVILACDSGRVEMWTQWGRTPTRTFGKMGRHIRTAIPSPDGQEILTLSLDGGAELWESGAGLPLRASHDARDFATATAASPDGRWLVTGGHHVLWLSEMGSARHTGTFDTGTNEGATGIAFSPDGSLVVCSTSETLSVYEVASRRMIWHWEGSDLCLIACSFIPGNRLMAVSTDGIARVWNLPSTDVSRTIRIVSPIVLSCSFSAGGDEVLVLSRDRAAVLCDTTEMTSRTLAARPYRASWCGFSPDGRTVVIAGADGPISVCDRVSLETVRTLDANTMVRSAAFSPDGSLLLTSGLDDTLTLWDLRLGMPIRRYPQPGNPFVASVLAVNGRYAAVTGLGDDLSIVDAGMPVSLEVLHGDPLLDATATIRRALANTAFQRRPTDASEGDFPSFGPSAIEASPAIDVSTPEKEELRALELLLGVHGAGGPSGRAWLHAAALGGSTRAMTRLAWALERGLGGACDIALATSLRAAARAAHDPFAEGKVEQAAASGDRLARVTLAAQKHDRAALEDAARHGEPDALLLLADLEPARAKDLLTRAVALGDPPALLKAALALEPDDPLGAVRLLEQAALSGHVPAVLELAKVYEQGLGVAPDPAKAEELRASVPH